MGRFKAQRPSSPPSHLPNLKGCPSPWGLAAATTEARGGFLPSRLPVRRPADSVRRCGIVGFKPGLSFSLEKQVNSHELSPTFDSLLSTCAHGRGSLSFSLSREAVLASSGGATTNAVELVFGRVPVGSLSPASCGIWCSAFRLFGARRFGCRLRVCACGSVVSSAWWFLGCAFVHAIACSVRLLHLGPVLDSCCCGLLCFSGVGCGVPRSRLCGIVSPKAIPSCPRHRGGTSVF